jgi:hypothetical protein
VAARAPARQRRDLRDAVRFAVITAPSAGDRTKPVSTPMPPVATIRFRAVKMERSHKRALAPVCAERDSAPRLSEYAHFRTFSGTTHLLVQRANLLFSHDESWQTIIYRPRR